MPKVARPQITTTELKSRCPQILDEVQKNRREVVITKRGKPVAQLVPIEEEPPEIFGRMRGTARIVRDIVGPTGEVWDAERDDKPFFF